MPIVTGNEKVNPDLEKERQTASFSIEEFAIWFYGGYQKLKAKRELEDEIVKDPELFQSPNPECMSFQDQYDDAVKQSVLLGKRLKDIQKKLNPAGSDIYPTLFSGYIATSVIPQSTPFFINSLMFIPTIENQGTPDQVAKWLPLAKNCNILGTYAQTELGHGSHIRGLQTRADYDSATEEFVLNTPSISAYKWWPAALGHTANYAVVIAQLYIKDKCYGIHIFLVQIRDTNTHMPLPGIHVGDIGNKLGLKSANNGFLGLKNVRIPRMQMLMRYAQVSPDGTYTSSPASVLSYLTMVLIRVLIVGQSSYFLTQPATIATRYAAVRRQGLINPKEPEHQILDYVTQQLKLFPEIAKGIAFNVAFDYLLKFHFEVTSEIRNGNYDRLAEIHALSACLKAITTYDSSAGVDAMRLACGGHGYMWASKLPDFSAQATSAITYEGENTVMLLQTARFLMKEWEKATQGESLVPTVAYLEKLAVTPTMTFPKRDNSLEWMVNALQFASANKIRVAFNHLSERMNKKMTPEESANATSIELTQAADLHGRSFLAKTFWTKITQETHTSDSLKTVLLDILELYLLSACQRNMNDLQRFIGLTENDINEMQIKLEQTLHRLRPNAVAIVDGFDHHDKILNSVLGYYDGNVYERLYEAAQKSPLNKIMVHKSFHTHLKPMFKSSL